MPHDPPGRPPSAAPPVPEVDGLKMGAALPADADAEPDVPVPGVAGAPPAPGETPVAVGSDDPALGPPHAVTEDMAIADPMTALDNALLAMGSLP